MIIIIQKGFLRNVIVFCILQTNSYWMVQGYRIFDLNILRVAMEDAQKCGHSKLVLTEVNPDTSKVAVSILSLYQSTSLSVSEFVCLFGCSLTPPKGRTPAS